MGGLTRESQGARRACDQKLYFLIPLLVMSEPCAGEFYGS